MQRAPRAISEYRSHYHHERNHQGLGNAVIDMMEPDMGEAGRIVRRERLGGLLSFYHREAVAQARADRIVG